MELSRPALEMSKYHSERMENYLLLPAEHKRVIAVRISAVIKVTRRYGWLCNKTCDWLKGSNGWWSSHLRRSGGSALQRVRDWLTRKQTFISSCRGKNNRGDGAASSGTTFTTQKNRSCLFPSIPCFSPSQDWCESLWAPHWAPSLLLHFIFCFSLISIKTIFHMCMLCSCASVHHMGSLWSTLTKSLLARS